MAAVAAVLYAHNNGLPAHTLAAELSAASANVCQPFARMLARFRKSVFGPPIEEELDCLLEAIPSPGGRIEEGCAWVPARRY